jgi:hypothetical protein
MRLGRQQIQEGPLGRLDGKSRKRLVKGPDKGLGGWKKCKVSIKLFLPVEILWRKITDLGKNEKP